LILDVKAWATPDCNTSSYSNGVFGQNIREQATNWITPKASDGKNGGPNQRGSKGDLMLPSMVAQWPTPSAAVVNDGESPETWHARAAKLKEKGINGNGAGLPLTVATVQWPTPAHRDGDPRRGATSPDSQAWANKVQRGAVNAAGMLSDDLKSSASAWPTPTSSDSKSQLSGGGAMVHRLNTRTQAPSLPQVVTHSPSLPQAQPTPDGLPSSPTTPNSPRHLNPLFGAWLMGWPSTWVIAEPHASSASATALWRSRLQQHLSCLLDGRQG
jgi:hypothetical protein